MTSKTQEFWLVGLDKPDEQFDIVGLFSDRGRALAACRSRLHFLGPLPLDVDLGDNTEDWPGLVYPLVEGSDDPR